MPYIDPVAFEAFAAAMKGRPTPVADPLAPRLNSGSTKLRLEDFVPPSGREAHHNAPEPRAVTNITYHEHL